MIIPKLHYIPKGNSPKEVLENIQKACTSGIELVQLVLEDVSEKKFLKIAEEAREITSHFQTRLIIDNQIKIAKTVKADGVVLNKSATSPTEVRKLLYTWQMIGGTANNLQDAEALLSKEVDYINLGPFKATANEDNPSPVLGLNGYTLLVEALKTETPIIAFGGLSTADVKALLEAGVSGITVSEEITSNFNSIKTFHQLLQASSIAEQRHTFE
ncbi:thiamine-phosphate pyrophosphorylase [Maribacter spongiicola]|uniref:Thiamine-phosphate pyrophosphorylase n=1 Tax=Maribacter spongiicola TaxID=1206753 RepID=A0A4V3ERC2_9FLAO|nr:thiamine phosphate synthase [Maribacter spongiicola]TDT45348.1 thiamine-phosphate pyrophosphorylase [Maribacter spongiicola]